MEKCFIRARHGPRNSDIHESVKVLSENTNVVGIQNNTTTHKTKLTELIFTVMVQDELLLHLHTKVSGANHTTNKQINKASRKQIRFDVLRVSFSFAGMTLCVYGVCVFWFVVPFTSAAELNWYHGTILMKYSWKIPLCCHFTAHALIFVYIFFIVLQPQTTLDKFLIMPEMYNDQPTVWRLCTLIDQ